MKPHAAGFTLIESLVTISVLAILLAIAIPNFQSTIDNRRLVGAADNILTAARQAQAEALKTNAGARITFTVGPPWTFQVSAINPTTGTLTATSTSGSGSDFNGTTLTLETPISGTGILSFESKRGATSLSISQVTKVVTITSALGRSISLTIDPSSRLSLCSNSSVGGYSACP